MTQESKDYITYMQTLVATLDHPMLVNVKNTLNSINVEDSDAVNIRKLDFLVAGPMKQVLRGMLSSYSTPAVQVSQQVALA